MKRSDDDKVAEGAFAGALSILAVLIAVVGLVGAAQDKIQGISYLVQIFELFQWLVVALSVSSAILALMALSHMRGGWVPVWAVAGAARVLIIGTALATVAFAWLG